MILHIYLNLGSFKRVHVSKFTSMQLHISSKFSTAVGTTTFLSGGSKFTCMDGCPAPLSLHSCVRRLRAPMITAAVYTPCGSTKFLKN